MLTHVSSFRRTPALLTLLLAMVASVLVGTTAGADASTTVGSRAVKVAAQHNGAPYHYGSAGPSRFDCSGLTMYAYKQVGKRLPHQSSAQYSTRYVKHISKSSKQVGDLIFMRNSSGSIYHVGIYAGHGNWWVAPHTGSHVKLQKIYTSHYSVGRVK